VKVPLFATPMPDGVSAAAGVLTVSDPAIADALRANPSGFYLNLHTKEFPGGAVRGQLTRLDHPVDLLGLLRGGAQKAFLSGDQEVPVAGGPAVGDPTARAVAFVKAYDTQVSYSFAWLGLNPTLGHIHKAPFGVNGPVVVPLFATAVPATIVAISGTVSGLDPALVKDIAEHPSAFYANLHSAQFPGGAVRGQLFNRH
jgi:CHRD domain